MDALKTDLLPFAARRRLTEEIRHEHIVELLKCGTVPLNDPAQIDGVARPEEAAGSATPAAAD
jgi:hypothetical protein